MTAMLILLVQRFVAFDKWAISLSGESYTHESVSGDQDVGLLVLGSLPFGEFYAMDPDLLEEYPSPFVEF